MLYHSSVAITRKLEQLIRSTSYPSAPFPTDWYIVSYPVFVKQFALHTQERSWDRTTVIEGFGAVYSWMPCTIKSINLAAIDQLPELLNSRSDPGELMPVLARCVSNSLVAGTKFGHIFQPDLIPILDSNNEWFCFPETPSKLSSSGAAIRRYFIYKEAIDMVSPELKEKAQRWASYFFGYAVSAVRAVEAMVFYTSASRAPRPGKARFG